MPATREIDRRWLALREAVPEALRPEVDVLRDLIGAQPGLGGLLEALQAREAEETRHRHEMERLQATQAHDFRTKLMLALGVGAGGGGLAAELLRAWHAVVPGQ